MSQDQLFTTHGAPRIYGRKDNRRRTERQRQLSQRLVGEGVVKTDPYTGRRWDTRRGSPKPAITWQCAACNTQAEGSKATKRRWRELCSVCFHEWTTQQQSAPIGTRRPLAYGYVEIKTEDGWMREHRRVMEGALGRTLQPEETVHHINGDRADNHPDNLQLRRSAHGPGQAHACLDCGSHNITTTPLAPHPGGTTTLEDS